MIENMSIKNKRFDHYIFIDYSEQLIGYIIVSKENLPSLLPKLSKFRHYKELKHKKTYLYKMKREFENHSIKEALTQSRILPIKDNLLMFSKVIEFIQANNNCIIFLSIDNNQFNAFSKLLSLIPHQPNITIRKESDLKKNSMEHHLSLIIDTMLNIERVSK